MSRDRIAKGPMSAGIGAFSRMLHKNAAARGLVQGKVRPRGKLMIDHVHKLVAAMENHKEGKSSSSKATPARAYGIRGDGFFADPNEKLKTSDMMLRPFHRPKPAEVQKHTSNEPMARAL